MYESYWDFTENPFSNAGGEQAIYQAESHDASLLKLRYLVEHGKGAGLLAGPGGVGKSLLVDTLDRLLPEGFGPVIKILFPQMSAAEILAHLAVKLGTDDASVSEVRGSLDVTLRHIELRLQEFTKQGRRPVIVVEDAHLVEDQRVFRAFQLLLNYQQPGTIEFTLLLTGQRELLGMVQRIPQLDERLAVKSLVQPLNEEEVSGYITHRLQLAGCDREIFTASARDVISQISAGIPRKINRLCDLALLVGYAEQLQSIEGETVEAAAEELVPPA